MVACVVDKVALFHDSATLECRASHAESDVCNVAFSPDGRFVAMGRWSKGVVMPVDQLAPPPTGNADVEAQPARPA